MAATTKAIQVSSAQARRIWLRAQRLDEPVPFGAGPEAVRAAVAHLGYVQIDTINVIERCHHHILWTRMPEYRRADLAQAQSIDKSVFEYWTHALAYVPAADLRYFLPDMKRRQLAPGAWFASVEAEDLKKVMALVSEGGPLSIRDIDDDVLVEKDHAWASRKPSKRALQLAFLSGALTVAARSGMLKSYELLDRHFGWAERPRAASEAQVLGYLLDRALRAQGLASLDSICHLDAGRKASIRALIDARVRRGRLARVEIEGCGRTEHWAEPAALAAATPERESVHILSPFDPLVIQRKRLAMFFAYEHRFEAYVPREKRVLGYFALPVLLDGEIVAAIDIKTDRAQRALLLQQWTWIGGRGSAADRVRVEEELGRFERFQFH